MIWYVLIYFLGFLTPIFLVMLYAITHPPQFYGEYLKVARKLLAGAVLSSQFSRKRLLKFGWWFFVAALGEVLWESLDRWESWRKEKR